MARGKPSLASTVNPEEIVYSGEELGNTPNFLLKDENGDETLGIIVNQYGYNLAVLKDCYKTEKNESGESVVVHYKKWDEFAYLGTFEAAYMHYIKYLFKKKDAQMRRAKDLKEIVKNREEIKKMVSEQLPFFVDGAIKESAELIKQKETLKHQINSVKKELDEMQPVVEEIKRTIRNAKKATKYTQMEEDDDGDFNRYKGSREK